MPAIAPCSILLLAGGRGQRMGGRDKGLLDWHGRPLIAWVAEVARPFSDQLIISCNRNAERYAAYADQWVEDADADFPGPLAGIRAGLAAARHPQLLVLPCDAPRIDAALLQALIALAGERPVMARRDGFWEPLFCVIPHALQGALENAWTRGERSLQRILRNHDPLALDCPDGDPRLDNFNDPATLAAPR